jgi:predicted outer membrane repeat protein
MKTKLLTSVVVLLFVGVNIGIPCGNQAPTADLAADMDFGVTAQTMTVTFDGSGSSDPDGGGGLDNSGIYEFAWDFGDGQTYWESADYHPDGKFDGKHVHTYTNTSSVPYVATLIVYDVSSEPSEEVDYSVYIKNGTIQDAIDAANGENKDTVAVAPGIYTGPGNCDLDFLGKAITVRSIDPNDPAVVAATIIDCYYDDEVYARGFCFDSGEGAESVVAGFTIINGWHDDNSGDDDNRGGAIYCIDDDQDEPSSPTIKNCVFTNNNAPDGGGAIYCENSAPTITNCVFSNNEAGDGDGDGDGDGGGIYAKGSTYAPTVTNCVFSKNTADGSGGGMCFEDASGIITDCNFVENYANGYGGGFSVFSEASPTTNPSPTLTNCFFNQNRTTQYGGGMDIYKSSPTVVNCVFNQNYASYDDEGLPGFGGGVSNSVSSSEFVNCTFYGNIAYGGSNGTGSGGGMYHDEYTTPDVVATITNCIFWENTDEHPNDTFNTDESAQIHHVGTQPGIENSCIDGLSSLSGTDNIDDDPLFVDADNPAGPDGVFRTYDDGLFLGIGGEEDSPCIDAGQTGDVPEEDITGFARPAGFEDMGAYEARSVLFVYGTAEGEDDGTSWANAFVYLQDALDAAASGVDEIWVAAGTYHPDLGGGRTPGDKTESFELVDGVAVYGGFAGGENGHCERTDWEGNETILSGDIGTPVTQTDNSYHVVKGISIDDAIIDGFTISDGYAYGSSPDCYGGGIYLSGGSPTIQNCSIEGNHAYYYGGGMYCTSSSPVMVNCTFSGNTARRGGASQEDHCEGR